MSYRCSCGLTFKSSDEAHKATCPSCKRQGGFSMVSDGPGLPLAPTPVLGLVDNLKQLHTDVIELASKFIERGYCVREAFDATDDANAYYSSLDVRGLQLLLGKLQSLERLENLDGPAYSPQTPR